MPLKHYQELVAWQLAMDFAEEVHRLTRSFPRDEMFALTSQVRRSAVSVPSNIAEGQGRGGPKEFVQFLNVSIGSLQEAETQLILGSRFGYVTDKNLEHVLEMSNEVGRVNNGLIRALVKKL
jgi:four helix bundle protein